MNTELLKQIGLTPGEIKVYFALLEIGSQTTGKISEKSGVHTSKIYPILEKLIQKGLSSYVIHNNVKYYQASPPEQIIDFLHNKKRKLEEQEEEIKRIIPEILDKQKFSKYSQSASVYEGVNGTKALFEIMLNEWQRGEEYLVFTPGDEFMNEEINTFFKKHHLKRIEQGITVKVLALESQRKFYEKTYKDVKNFEFRYTHLSLPAGLNIVHNKVSTLIGEPFPVAFVIDSPFIAERYRKFFNNLWEVAKP